MKLHCFPHFVVVLVGCPFLAMLKKTLVIETGGGCVLQLNYSRLATGKRKV